MTDPEISEFGAQEFRWIQRPRLHYKGSTLYMQPSFTVSQMNQIRMEISTISVSTFIVFQTKTLDGRTRLAQVFLLWGVLAANQTRKHRSSGASPAGPRATTQQLRLDGWQDCSRRCSPEIFFWSPFARSLWVSWGLHPNAFGPNVLGHRLLTLTRSRHVPVATLLAACGSRVWELFPFAMTGQTLSSISEHGLQYAIPKIG